MNYFEKPTIKITIYCQKNEIHIVLKYFTKEKDPSLSSFKACQIFGTEI